MIGAAERSRFWGNMSGFPSRDVNVGTERRVDLEAVGPWPITEFNGARDTHE
jgi:hypothetical protein